MASPASKMRILISGASGMVGRALMRALSAPSLANGFSPQIYTLVRRAPASDREIYWDPYEMRIDMSRLSSFDAVVHLAGENVGSGDGGLLGPTGRWSERKKHMIMESRRRGTLLLSRAIAASSTPPAVLVAASGVGYYGSSRGDELCDEASAQGSGFLSQVAAVWEGSTAPAVEAGIRVVNLRFGVILDARDGVLNKLYWPFACGVGGPIGSGSQYMSYISLQDAVRVISFALTTPSLSGPVNACTPSPVTNATFSSALGAAMHRPALLPMPTVVARTVFGEMGDETLLASNRCTPAKLTAAGFRFNQPDIHSALEQALRGDE